MCCCCRVNWQITQLTSTSGSTLLPGSGDVGDNHKSEDEADDGDGVECKLSGSVVDLGVLLSVFMRSRSSPASETTLDCFGDVCISSTPFNADAGPGC